ncbi:hypothetical protein [uncultured Tenacibaculum sp.]|uniref:hypothetical protein n=1 Tax=uncultured Tenacibaculum sp. TaxID=174713 RepID=UPI002619D9C8|nr:hypothetical protein [uncultured Tenacibaculum sp.]
MFKLKQINTEKLSEIDFADSIDLFIGCLGYEERAIYQAKEIFDNIKDNIIIVFGNHEDEHFRKINEEFFKKNNFNLLYTDTPNKERESLLKIDEKINEILNNSNDVVNVYIDYSSMTKSWYSHILLGIFNNERKENLKIILGYSHAEHVRSKLIDNYNRIVTPLFGYCNLSVPNIPTSVVIGLGNEANRVIGLKEYFDTVPFVFHSDETYNSEYYKDATDLLESYLSRIPSKNIFTYPINDLIYTYYLMENLCSSLIKNHRVIIAPCGPKPFTVLSLILSLKYSDIIEVWQITPGDNLEKINRKPTGLVTILELDFIKDAEQEIS